MFCKNNTGPNGAGRFSRLSDANNSKINMDDNKFTTAFDDLNASAYSKAFAVSPHIKNTTLGPKSSQEDETLPTDCISQLEASIFKSSTPKKEVKRRNKLIDNNNCENKKLQLTGCSFSPIILETGISDNSYSQKKMIHEIDLERRLTVEVVMNERIRNMHDTDKLIHDSLVHLRKTRQEEALTKRILSEQKILDDLHEQEILNRPKREAQLAQVNLKNAQRVQERIQRVKEAEEKAKQKSEAILLKRKQLDKILEWQREYGAEYKNMLETIKLCKDKAALTEVITSQSKNLKNCAAGCENLIKKCKHGDITESDIEDATNLVETLKSIHRCFISEIKRIEEAAVMEESRIQEETKAREAERSVIQDVSKPEVNNDLSDCFDIQSLQAHLNIRTYLDHFQKSYTDLVSDDSTKKFRFTLQKAVTIPVNAISPYSGNHLADKYVKLHNLLSGQAVFVADTNVSASQHPSGIAYCKNLLAKKFVRQGDLTVSSKPDAAFSIAAVLASLWVDFPDFGQLVLAHFQLECPYLAPVFMPQVEGQSNEDYHKSLGYHYMPNGEVEKQDSFLKRMSGFMRLYAALIIAKVRQSGKSNPLGLAEGWRWISALLNLEPRPDICATLIYDFLEVAGHEMFRCYGGQFKKLLAYICQEYFPKLEKITPASAGGPIVRLEGFLQKVLKEESIPCPDGVLPPNFW